MVKRSAALVAGVGLTLCASFVLAGAGEELVLSGTSKSTPLLVKDTSGAEVLLVAENKKLPVDADKVEAISTPQDQLIGSEADDSDLFGVRGGYFQPTWARTALSSCRTPCRWGRSRRGRTAS